VGRNNGIVVAEGVGAVARPAIVAGRGDHQCAHWIQLDVAQATEQVRLSVDECRLVPTFPQRPSAPMQEVEPADISPPKGLHHPRQRLRMRWRREQVDVIGHQHVRVNRHLVRPRRVAQAIKIEAMVVRAREYGRAIVAALNDVEHRTGVEETRLTWHAGSVRSSGIAAPSSKRRL